MTTLASSLVIGPSFFLHERRAYSNWREALIKEIMQNAVDSRGCGEIHFELVKGENTTTIIAKDNGQGMSKETLLNVFLVLGETTKSGPDSVGGFGVARNLICFSNNSYVIKSHNYVCRGSGAGFTVEETEEYVKGCVFEIETEHHDWEHEIKRLVNRSNIYPDVFINGEHYHIASPHRGRMVRQLSFADVYVNKSAEPALLVRVKGLLMFQKYVDNLKARVVVEIDPTKSREVLTSNRYGLQYTQDNELQSFLNELASETQSALSDKTKHFKKLVNKDKHFTTKPKAKVEKANVPSDIVEAARASGMELVEYLAVFADKYPHYAGATNPIDTESLPIALRDPITESMMILNESNDPEIVRTINYFYHPEKWTKGTETRYKLLKIWHKICEKVIEAYCDATGNEYAWAVGWVFSDAGEECVIAKHLSEDSVHYLLINPLDKDCNMRYGINDKNDIKSLIVSAVHEVSHFANNRHDQAFAYTMTDLMEKVLWISEEIYREVKAVK